MKWTVTRPKVVAEDDTQTVTVEADDIEGAIIKAGEEWHIIHLPGCVFNVHVRVEVTKRPRLPLKSV